MASLEQHLSNTGKRVDFLSNDIEGKPSSSNPVKGGTTINH